MKYELDDPDRAILAKVEYALQGIDDGGEPLKDNMDEDDLIDALRLLSNIVKAETKRHHTTLSTRKEE